MPIEMIEEFDQGTRIKVIGVGGGGGNAVLPLTVAPRLKLPRSQNGKTYSSTPNFIANFYVGSFDCYLC